MLVFISGPVAITVRDWEQRGEVADGGARTGLRRGEQAAGLNHRAGRRFHDLAGQRQPVAASRPVSWCCPIREHRASAITRSP